MAGWTDERRQRQREIIMRVRPWERSTGPKTTRGKRKAAANGRKTTRAKVAAFLRALRAAAGG